MKSVSILRRLCAEVLGPKKHAFWLSWFHDLLTWLSQPDPILEIAGLIKGYREIIGFPSIRTANQKNNSVSERGLGLGKGVGWLAMILAVSSSCGPNKKNFTSVVVPSPSPTGSPPPDPPRWLNGRPPVQGLPWPQQGHIKRGEGHGGEGHSQGHGQGDLRPRPSSIEMVRIQAMVKVGEWRLNLNILEIHRYYITQ